MVAPRHHLFYAILPPREQALRIGLLRDGFGPVPSVVRNDRLHITMGITPLYPRFPGEVADRMIEIGGRAASGPLPILLDRIVGSRRSVALRPAKAARDLRDLQDQLCAPLARHGLLLPEWRFSPHVTLLYRTGAPFSRRTQPIAWDSAEFVLIHSVAGRTEHIQLARWPLAPRQSALL